MGGLNSRPAVAFDSLNSAAECARWARTVTGTVTRRPQNPELTVIAQL
jgi:hypothetical protein